MNLTDQEKKLVYSFVSKFNVASASNVLEFGKEVENRINMINNEVFNKTKDKDTTRIEELIKIITNELLKTNPKQKKVPWYKLLFGLEEETIEKPNYNLMIDSISSLVGELKSHIITLQKDLQLIELLKENSVEYLHELDMYLLCGELILRKANQEALNAKNNKDELLYNDLMNAINNFEKRIYDLKLMRQITVQSMPQMNLIRDNNYLLIDRINYLINSTIPLWKNQIIIMMSSESAKRNTEITSEVSNMMNQLLSDNATGLLEMSQSTKDELKNGNISSKTLAETTKMIISSLDEISKINKSISEKEDSRNDNQDQVEDETKTMELK